MWTYPGSIRGQLLALIALCALAGPCTAIACGTPQTQIFAVGNPSKDKACKYDSIQKAIDAATCTGSTILISSSGSYTKQRLTIKNKSLLLIGTSQCSGEDKANPPPRTVIDGANNGYHSVFTIVGGGDVAMENLWIENGVRGDGWSTGGAIDDEVTKGSLTLENTVITQSSAWLGGGIFMRSDSANLDIGDNVLIEFNTADVAGGGVEIEGNVVMSMTGRNSAIYSNAASGLDGGGYGGGISAVSPARVNLGSPGLGFGGAGSIESNTAIFGGGIALVGTYGCTAQMQMFTTDPAHPTQISNNVASKFGGAFYLTATGGAASLKQGYDDYNNPCTPDADQIDLHDFVIAGNKAAEGSAFYFEGFGISNNPDGGVSDNPAGGPVLNFNMSSLAKAGVTRYGAVPCARNVECNVIRGNLSQTIDPKTSKPASTTGATISAQWPVGNNPPFQGTAGIRFNGNRFRMHDNVGGSLIANRYDDGNSTGVYQNHFALSECLLDKNRVSGELLMNRQRFIEPVGATSLALDSCTIADNIIDATSSVIVNNNSLSVKNSIISQPGVQAEVTCGCATMLSVENLVGEDLQGLPSGTSTETDPLFVDRANADYSLKATSLAVDFAATDAAAVDLQGNARNIDLAEKNNLFGARDLGALERQINTAASSQGSTAVASSTYSPVTYPPSAAIDGDRTGVNGVNAGFWNDATQGMFPDSLQVNFNAMRQIGRIDVYMLQDNYAMGVDPSETLTGSLYVLTAFDVQYLDPATSAWVTVQSINGNNLVKREIVLPAPVTTSAIRVFSRAAGGGYSRLVELEAFAG